MKALLALLTALIALATPAYSQVIDEPNGGSVTQSYMVQYEIGGVIEPQELVGYGQPHTVGEVIDPNDPAPTMVYASTPITTVETFVTVSDNLGEHYTFDIVWSGVGMAIAIASIWTEIPADVSVSLAGIDMLFAAYNPAVSGVYAGVNDYVQNVINAGITAAGTGGSIPLPPLPPGPDPLFNYSFALGTETFTGTFDAYGTVDDPVDLSNITLNINGIPIADTSVVPGPIIGAGVPGLVIGLFIVIGLRRQSRDRSPTRLLPSRASGSERDRPIPPFGGGPALLIPTGWSTTHPPPQPARSAPAWRRSPFRASASPRA